MAIDRKFLEIPDGVAEYLYVPTNQSKNAESFRNVSRRGDQIQIVGLDNLAIWTSDVLQEINKYLDTMNRDRIGVNGLKGQVLYFSADNVLNVISLQDLITSIVGGLVLDGSKITKETIYGASLRKRQLTKEHYGIGSIETEAIKDLAVTAGKIFGQIPLSKMISSGKKCLLMGTAGSNAYTEKVADNQSQPWYVFCNDPSITSISLNSLATIWKNTPYTFDGSKITDNSLTLDKLAQDVLTAIRNNDFATATVSINGTLLRKKNVSSVIHLGTGKYRVNFTSQPPSGSINYNVQLSIGGTYSCSWANKTLNSIDVNIFTVTKNYDAPFDIVVSDAGT